MTITDSLVTLFFGDTQHAFIPQYYQGFGVLKHKPFFSAVSPARLKQLVFLHQVHGATGKVVSSQDLAYELPSFVHDGDFLITNVARVGIGVATADCLSIVVVDTRHKAIGIAHAGWRGAVESVGVRMLEKMQDEYGTQASDVTVFFGPSARACCYEVREDCISQLKIHSYADSALQQRNSCYFFDGVAFNRLQLECYGVPPHAINESYAHCTICNQEYCSARRTKGGKERQMSVVALVE